MAAPLSRLGRHQSKNCGRAIREYTNANFAAPINRKESYSAPAAILDFSHPDLAIINLDGDI